MIKENTLFGERDKVDDSIFIIRRYLPKEEPLYVAFSGGKDSIVLLDIVKKSGVKYDAHFHLTSVDPPELLRFMRENYPDIERVKPKKSMHNLIIQKRLPPTRRVRYCCDYLKEGGGHGRYVAVGVRAEESSKRANRGFFNEFKGKKMINPLLMWTEGDIWEYIEENNLKYPSLYDEGFSRIGCVMCPLAGKAQMLIDAKRWPHIYKMYMGAFDKSIKHWADKGNPSTQKTAQEMMDWWINGA